MRFEVFLDETVVGWTELESGDPPMGVALGRFHPNDAYIGLKPGSTFRVRASGGEFLEPSAGVHIADHSAELGPDAIEICILGLDAAAYREHFAAHMQAYEDHFKRSR